MSEQSKRRLKMILATYARNVGRVSAVENHGGVAGAALPSPDIQKVGGAARAGQLLHARELAIGGREELLEALEEVRPVLRRIGIALPPPLPLPPPPPPRPSFDRTRPLHLTQYVGVRALVVGPRRRLLTGGCGFGGLLAIANGLRGGGDGHVGRFLQARRANLTFPSCACSSNWQPIGPRPS